MNLEIIKIIIPIVILIGLHVYYSRYASFIKSSGGLGRVGTVISNYITLITLTFSIPIIIGLIADSNGTNVKIYFIFIRVPILIVIFIILLILLAIKSIIIFTDNKKCISTLYNCSVYKNTYTAKLVGVSKEGTKNTFKLIGKDANDVYRMLNSGILVLQVEYYTTSKYIKSIKPMMERRI